MSNWHKRYSGIIRIEFWRGKMTITNLSRMSKKEIKKKYRWTKKLRKGLEDE